MPVAWFRCTRCSRIVLAKGHLKSAGLVSRGVASDVSQCVALLCHSFQTFFFKVFHIAFTHESVCGLSAAISRKVCAAIHNRNKWPATYPICGNMWHGHIFGAPFVERNQPTASVCQFQRAFCTTTAAPHKHPLRFGFVSSKGVFS